MFFLQSLKSVEPMSLRELTMFMVSAGEMLRLALSVRKNLAFYRGKCQLIVTPIVAAQLPMVRGEA